MSDSGSAPEPRQTSPRAAVADAIQNLMAARLGRGFVPLALLFAWGLVGLLQGSNRLWIAGGAVASAIAMLAYGLRIVQKAIGRPPKAWMRVAILGSVVPPAYGLCVLGWDGLRALSRASGAWSVLSAILHFGLGVWVLRSWMKVVEIERLAQVMTVNLDGDGGVA